MLVGKQSSTNMGHVEFVSYDGHYPNLCHGTLVLKIDGNVYRFGYSWHQKDKNSDKLYMPFWSSGGGINPNYEGTYSGEWRIDVSDLPEEIQCYAAEIDEVFNANVRWGCCGGCI